MKLVYQADLEDVSQPAIRHYLRSETARKSWFWSTARGALLGAAAWAFVFRQNEEALIGAGIAGAVLGGLLNHLTHVPTVRKRILRHMQRETEGRLPATTTYEIGGGKLSCDHLGASVAFPLSDVEAVTEDGKYLEISFGKTGLCTIPLRAFGSQEEKAEFVAALKAETGL